MQTQTHTTSSPVIEFKGLDDWFEIFEGGPQVASNGQAINLSESDLDKIVANSNGESSPLVYGHPKDNDPAYGWTKEYKRDGLKILAKADSFAQEFSDSVEQGFYPKRSASLVQTSDGYKVNHIGFLGAMKPAVKTLADIEFNALDDALLFEFAMAESERREVSYGMQTVARIARKWRDHLIEKLSIKEADQIIQPYEVEAIEESARNIRSENPIHEFTENQNQEDVTMPGDNAEPVNFTQAEFDQQKDTIKNLQAQIAANSKAANFAEAKHKASATIDALLKEGKLLPAQTKGDRLAEFMAHLQADESTVVEFSEGDGTVKQSHYQVFAEFLESLGKQINFGRDDSAEPGGVQAPTDFHGHQADEVKLQVAAKAHDMAMEKNISFAQAAQLIEQENS